MAAIEDASTLWVGVDVGSVTVKVAVIEPGTRAVLRAEYVRHNAQQALTVQRLLRGAHAQFPEARFEVAVCGSGGESVARVLGAPYVQEVVANVVAVKSFFPLTKVAIELGGQDAKVIFFQHDPVSGDIVSSDMRMNGSCAGGTGAFIDQMAELLEVSPDEFGALAERGKNIYDVSGRCGVFAKTDIQPLLNQCVSREDIALSVFHALAKQTIGGLVQAMEVAGPVIFEGGPLTFNPRLVAVFADRLGLAPDDVIVPEHPELIVAHGAALALGALFDGQPTNYRADRLDRLGDPTHLAEGAERPALFFTDPTERREFEERHALPEFEARTFPAGATVPVFIGLDAGSTTSKFVLLGEDGEIIDKFYANNGGEPLRVAQRGLLEVFDRYREQGVSFKVRALGTTGYGEHLFAKAFGADFHTVETVAHAEAARRYAPEVSFILDIGGQDMKAIQLGAGVVTGITLNEACSAGCGSFIETFARSMGVPVGDLAGRAFEAEHPSHLGSRCTVFMNSSVITEQKNGKSVSDIVAGLVRSVIENVFTKVVRVANFDQLGTSIVVQGGTFKNDAVLRALEQYTERSVVRPPHPGEMGAIGIALLAKKAWLPTADQESRFIGLDRLRELDFTKEMVGACAFCSNSCKRTLITFSGGEQHIIGNRCERGEILGDPGAAETRRQLKETNARMKVVPDLFQLRHRLLFKNYHVGEADGLRIGLPRCLEFWHSMPFWSSFFRALGHRVVISRRSDYPLFERGLASVPSDTICFPAKLAHGHVQDLIARRVDRIFMPSMTQIERENATATAGHTCAVVQGYPLIVQESDEPTARHGIPFDYPVFRWIDPRLRDRQLIDYFSSNYGASKQRVKSAIAAGDAAIQEQRRELLSAGAELLHGLEGTDDFGVVLAGRPYHSDELVNHELARHFTRLGIPVLPLDALPGLTEQDLGRVRAETVNPLHVRMFAAAIFAARHSNLEVVQIVSFGCGHDAVITEEMTRLLDRIAGKQLLVLKLDEGEAVGPLSIRVRSFVETVRARREQQRTACTPSEIRELPPAFDVRFEGKHARTKIILAPNLSEAFATIVTAIGRRAGYRVEPLPIATPRAIELGKKYLHNDICYPAQLNVGEFLALMETGRFDPDEVVLGLAKNCEDCRAGQYAALARKALDSAGFPQVPIMTTGEDTKGMHPGFKMGLGVQAKILWGIAVADVLEGMLRRTRPYELEPGMTDRVYERHFRNFAVALEQQSKHAVEVLWQAVQDFNTIPIISGPRRPRVGIIGEILLNYHPVANGNIVRYLERHGMECILPAMVDFFRRDIIRLDEGARRHQIPHPWLHRLLAGATEQLFSHVCAKVEVVAREFRFHETHPSVYELANNIDDFIDRSYMVGEGWLIPAEIIELARHGVNSFVIVQPFGCLPNHITGRGLMKSIKRRAPLAQIVSLDYDPDTSFANVENRLQMLIMGARELERRHAVPSTPLRSSAS